MKLKPNINEARKYWNAFWAGEIIDRPAICLRVAPGPNAPPLGPGLILQDDPLIAVRQYGEWAAHVKWLAESVPHHVLNYGPDQFAAWLGARLGYSADSGGTTWSVPFIDDWDTDGAEIDHPHGEWWDRAVEVYRGAGEIAAGRFVIGVPDTHSNMDALSALRGPQAMCEDLLDVPEKVDRAMLRVRKAFAPVLEAVGKAARMDKSGYIGWLPFYSETPYAVLQCDFACMVGPEHFRRWILPALEEESSYLDHSVYHYDGPDALVHLKDVLSIEGIRAIQWVPGSGNPPVIEWMDLLKTMQKAGKGLYLGGSPDEIKIYHRELRPEHVLYDVTVGTEQEADDLLSWLRKNT